MKIEKNIINWRILEIKNNILHIEGRDNFWLPRENYFYYCKIKDKTYFPKYIKYEDYDFLTMYGNIEFGRIIVFDIPFEKDSFP